MLNLLQSANMTFPQIDENVIYLTAGAAQPGVIDSMVTSLLSDPFNVAYANVCKATSEYGYALVDINTAISLRVASLELPSACVSFLMDRLSNVEYRLSHGVNEKIQIAALVGAFVCCRKMLTPVNQTI